MSKEKTFTATVTRDGSAWGEYVRGGETYVVTPIARAMRRPSRVGSYHFWNVATKSGTYMQPWAFNAAVARGDVVVAV